MSIRLISRLDIKGAHLIKGVQMEGWRKVGDPAEMAERYYHEGIDEIIYLDAVASLYQRNNLIDIVKDVASKAFVPITVGGGISDHSTAELLMKAGADKLAVNTQATKTPEFLTELKEVYGSQAVVANIEAKKTPNGRWVVMTDNGRNHTGLDVIEWALKVTEMGAGEILLTSVDFDGTNQGMDLKLIEQVCDTVAVPVIASGGCGNLCDAKAAIEAGADAIAVGASLHFNRMSIADLRMGLRSNGFDLRPFTAAG